MSSPKEGSAEDEQSAPKPSPEEKASSNYALLCRIMVEGSAIAMREVFDTVHPAISLPSRLQQAQVMKTLRRLHQQRVIEKTQWGHLYPSKGNIRPSSDNFDVALLMLLLRNMCHLSPPYPNGWEGIPLRADTGIAADLTRLDYFRKVLLSINSITDADLNTYYSQIIGVLARLSSSAAVTKIERVACEQLSNPQMKQAIKSLQSWHQQAIRASAVDNLPHDGTSSSFAPGFKLPQIETDQVRSVGDNLAQLYPYVISEDGHMSQMLQVPGATRSARASGGRSPVPSTFLKQDKAILTQFHKDLVENIRSDVVLPKLVKQGVITHEERNSINLATRNVDRIKALLRVLPQKSGNAFLAFCEAIKYKYTSIYDQLMKAKQLAMERPDELTEMGEALQSSYMAEMSKYHPIPWHPKAMVDVRDFFVPLYITDQQGREWSPSTLFVGYNKVNIGRGRRILLEGESGVGKSTVMRYVAAEWANGSHPLTDTYRLVFHLDVKLIKNGLIEAILEYDLPAKYQRDPGDLRHIIRVCQKEVMFLLDGLEDLSPKVTAEIIDLIQGRLFPESSLVVTVNSSYVTPSLLRNFDTKLVVMGLRADMQEELVLRYNDITETQTETFTPLLARIDNDHDTAVHVLSLNPLFCLCMCLLCEVDSALEMTTPTHLLQETLAALHVLYCRTNKMEIGDAHTQEFLQTLTQDLDEMAWRCMHENGSFFQYEQVGMSSEENPMFSLGILQQHVSPALPSLHQCFFPNRVFQDFMAARVLSHLDAEDFKEFLHSLVQDSYYSNVTKYFCGLHRHDSQAQQMVDLIEGLADLNRSHWRGPSPNGDPSQTHGTSVFPLGEGRLYDFKLSLECINECEGLYDMTTLIAESLPPVLASHNKDIPTAGQVNGLSYILRLDKCRVTKLDLRLDHFAFYQVYPVRVLASTISTSIQLQDLKLRWVNPEFLALFLVNLFKEKTNLTSIHCQETKGTTADRVTAEAWSNLQIACQRMDTISRVIFTNCSNKAIISSILHHIPFSLEELNLTNCTIDLVSAQELGLRIEKSQSLSTLNLTSCSICRPDFGHISAGLKLSSALEDLNLSWATLDITCFIALSEALKFNHSLQRLDISGSRLTDEACLALGEALGINHTLQEVVVANTLMSPKGKHSLWRAINVNTQFTRNESSRELIMTRPVTVLLSPLLTPNMGGRLTAARSGAG